MRTAMATALAAVALAIVPASAPATPPTLVSVTVPPGGNHPTLTWTLPEGVGSVAMQAAKSDETDQDGYFRQRELVSSNPLKADQTTFTDDLAYRLGTYYVHVAGHDAKCVIGACPSVEFSNIMTFDVVAPLPPGGGGGGGGGGTADKVAPLETLSYAALQHIDKLFVKARANEAGTLSASATVSVAGASKVYRFKTVTKSVSANVSTKLRLKLAKKRLTAVKKALKKGKHLKAKVTVTARDKAKNKRSQKATIRLKR
jgi:hypothetical protein